FEPWAESVRQRKDESVVFSVDLRGHGPVDLVAIRVNPGVCSRKQLVGGHAEDQVAIVPSDRVAVERIEPVKDLEWSLTQPHQISLAHENATIGHRFRAVFALLGTP